MDVENVPERQPKRVIRTPEELAAALAERFLANAAAGDNDALVQQLGEWKRRRRQ
ncbi:hypothetical protein [Amycolatopsis echigonensis]|uniref:Uncharacterized protein n=1 Tax=Amycolatopsis echigonensis TaxID=2576905 RepID=A0A8E1W7E2_9PSEU|nr:hypothetical protein [Amycolatopsis echigonensis]MBB2505252.1 hypothetical protein [Amycolatopsis echigonensis]